jgi:hypothetical protein
MNRRKFLSTGGLFLLLSSIGTTIACPGGSSVFDTIFQYATLGLQAFQVVLNILSGSNVIPVPLTGTLLMVVSLVKAGFADLQVIVKEYEAAPADQKDTVAHRISTVLYEIENHIIDFWSGLNIPDQKVASLVQSLVGLIVSTLSGFQIKIPGAPSRQLKPSKLGNIQPKTLTPHEFKSQFNQLLEQHGSPHRIK